MHSVIIASFIGLAAGAFDYSGSATLKDVTEFFSTTNKIILLARSYTHMISGYEPMCIYHHKVVPSENNLPKIVVNQHYMYGDERKQSAFSYPVYYTLSRNQGMDVAPVMRATNRSDGNENRNERTYFFHYYDPVMKCAVITFADNSRSTKCELHIWEENYGTLIENCRREFLYRCPDHQYYFPSEHALCPLSLKRKLETGYFRRP
uniref:Lipocalin n=1 Tax=Hyalomma excavatum TaxID=257692 RepID=A0A131XLE0_9ACAR